jgi:hypothetical protein
VGAAVLVGTAVVVVGAWVVAGTIVVVGAAVVVVSVLLLHAEATSSAATTTSYFFTIPVCHPSPKGEVGGEVRTSDTRRRALGRWKSRDRRLSKRTVSWPSLEWMVDDGRSP